MSRSVSGKPTLTNKKVKEDVYELSMVVMGKRGIA